MFIQKGVESMLEARERERERSRRRERYIERERKRAREGGDSMQTWDGS